MKKIHILIFSLILIGITYPGVLFAANPGTILSSDRYASLQDKTKVDFGCGAGFCDVKVYDDKLTGKFYVPIPEGPFVELNNSSPIFQVKNNGAGILSGAAVGLAPGGGVGEIGPVLFNAPPFQVTINPNTGEFSGYAFSSAIGTIKFQCPGEFCVKTDWRPGSSASASGSFLPKAGVCGPANGSQYEGVSDIPATDYCVSGAGGATPASGSGTVSSPWIWSCLGLYGGTSASCMATKTAPAPVADLCPSIAGTQTTLPCPTVSTPTPTPTPTKPTPITKPTPTKPTPTPTTVTTPTQPELIPEIGNIYTPEGLIRFLILLGLFMGILPAITGTMFFHKELSNILFIPTRIIQLLGSSLFGKKNMWGIVYDSLTGEAIDPARVYLREVTGIKSISTTTDIFGRYGFNPKKGVYKIFVSKRGYNFPSTKLYGKDHDFLHDNLYYGGDIAINERYQDIKLNIPIDRVKEEEPLSPTVKRNKTKRIIRREKLFRITSSLFFSIGFILSALAFFFTPIPYNLGIIAAYIFLIILKKGGVLKYIPRGSISLLDGEPASYALIRAYFSGQPEETARVVADKFGRYHLPLPNGVYIVKIDVNTKMGYLPAITSNPIEIEEGALYENFKI